ncbi:DNA gyrase inhibitor YacG [Roseateles sp. SL47]|nr:DNA gyrase inhibitor YacG [Roseateles sp. SL47]WAC75992.1 DNA gyrase inhibitor YacG [Roseateles sp. SL47]
MTPASSLSAASPTVASPPRIVPCPTCGGDSIFAPSNLWRPFCGERCRQIDLGHWADESFRVAAPPTTENENDAEQ